MFFLFNFQICLQEQKNTVALRES